MRNSAERRIRGYLRLVRFHCFVFLYVKSIVDMPLPQCSNILDLVLFFFCICICWLHFTVSNVSNKPSAPKHLIVSLCFLLAPLTFDVDKIQNYLNTYLIFYMLKSSMLCGMVAPQQVNSNLELAGSISIHSLHVIHTHASVPLFIHWYRSEQ